MFKRGDTIFVSKQTRFKEKKFILNREHISMKGLFLIKMVLTEKIDKVFFE